MRRTVNNTPLVVLHLILAVVDDPIRTCARWSGCWRQGGRAAVFDKFLPDGASPPGWRRALNVPAGWPPTSIAALPISCATPSLRVAHDEPALWAEPFG